MSCCDTLPQNCCAPLPCPTLNIQGPPGQSSFAPLISNLTVPANTATPVTLNVTSSAWMLPGMKVLVGDAAEGVATFIVSSITSPTAATVLWLQAPGDVASGTTFTTANSAGAAPTGAPGFGVNGINAFTLLTANATVPPDFITPITLSVANSQWVTAGQYLVIGDVTDGVFTIKVTSVPSTTSITGLWQNAKGDLASGSTVLVSNGASVSPSGAPGVLGPRNAQEAASGAVQNSGTGATVLMNYGIPAGGLANNGDYIDFEAVFELTQNGNTKTVTINFGATAVATISGAQNTANSLLIITGRVTRLTANTQFAYSTLAITTGGALATITTLQSAPGESLTGVVTLNCIGQSSAASGDVRQRTLRVRYVPI